MKFYLYGAGQNAWHIVKFLGRENVEGIIDSAPGKDGSTVDGVAVHLLKWYLDRCGEYDYPVVISAFIKGEEVMETLRQNGCTDFLEAPYMQAGMLPVAELSDWLAEDNRKIVFDDTTLLSFLIADYLERTGRGTQVLGFVHAGNVRVPERLGLPVLGDVPSGATLALTKNDAAEDDGTEQTSDATESTTAQDNNRETLNVVRYIYFNPCFRHPELSHFKDIHKGKRCFIIGNGPSLRMEDLDTLADSGEICFASNGIFLAYPKTKWRPTYYSIIDFDAYRKGYHALELGDANTYFIRTFYNDNGLEPPADTNRFHVVFTRKEPFFSDDITGCVCSGGTVTYCMMQIAAYMGFSEMYLLGVDNTCGTADNHFVKDYDTYAPINSFQLYPDVILPLYQTAELWSRSHGIRIYNATRGGALEVFERVDFDRLF